MKEQATVVRKTRDGSFLTLPMNSWYGGSQFDHLFELREFPIPSKWDVQIFEPQGLRGAVPLSAEQILRGLRDPIGADSLTEMASGRRDAVIIVDDLSRPTPAFAVLPHILDELAAGGLREEVVLGGVRGAHGLLLPAAPEKRQKQPIRRIHRRCLQSRIQPACR